MVCFALLSPFRRTIIHIQPSPVAGEAFQSNSSAAALADADGATPSVLAVCAGSRYTLDINFGGGLVNALVTSSAGKLAAVGERPALAVVNDAAEALGLLKLYGTEW